MTTATKRSDIPESPLTDEERRELIEDQNVIERYLKDVVLGRECSRFLESKVGRFLLDMAIQEEDAARTALVEVDPTDADAIRELQFKARVPNLVFSWLNEAIRVGVETEKILDEEL